MPDAPSDYSRWYDYFQSWFDYFHPTFRCARGGCFARSRGGCQGCGYGRAEHAHHWALHYPPPEATTSDDLTGFCRLCHRVITLLRRFLSVGGDAGCFLSILEAALAEAGEIEDAKTPLFQSVDRSGRLSGRSLTRRVVLAMIKRRAAAAGLPASTCCHTFRATGITAYLSNGGTLEHAQQIAGHASPRTTKLYDRTADTVTLDGDRTYRDLTGPGVC